MNKYICKFCGEEFDKCQILANHVRWKHIKPPKDNLIKARKKRVLEEQGTDIDYDVICHNCNIEFIVTEPSKKFPKKNKYFCSRSCANTREHSEETKNKIRQSINNKLETEPEYKEKCISNLRSVKNLRNSSKGEREIRKHLKDIW